MSLAHAIAIFQTGSYTVTRTAAGTHTAGRYTPGSTSTFTVDAVVQPVTGREFVPMPECPAGHENKLVHCTTALATLAGGRADRIALDGGEPWVVYHAEFWSHTGETFCRALVSRAVTP